MLFEESKWYSLFGPFETSGTLHERTPYALVWEVSNERTEGRRRITYDRKRGRGGRTGRLEVISYPNKPGRWRGARNESGQPTPAHCSPKRFPGSYPRRSPFPSDRLRGGMTRATPVEASLPSLSVIASSPLLPTARNQASINASIIEFAYRQLFTRRNHDKTVSRY